MKKFLFILVVLGFPLIVQAQSFDLFGGLRNTSGFSVEQKIAKTSSRALDTRRRQLNYLVGLRVRKNKDIFSIGIAYIQSGGIKDRKVASDPAFPAYSIDFELAEANAHHINLMLDRLKSFTINELECVYGVELFASLNHKDEYTVERRSTRDSINFILRSGSDYYRRQPNVWTLRPSFKLGVYYPLYKNKISIGVEVLPGISWQFVRGDYLQREVFYDFVNGTQAESSIDRFDKSSQIHLGLQGQATIVYKLFNK